ncbi:MAG: cytochrome-c peroxidase [Akkermansiaceae bacterium]
MKAPAIILAVGLSALSLSGQDTVSEPAPQVFLDLTKLHSYANQEVPDYINRDNTPQNNPITDIGATLGRVLFYDKSLSRNGTISCASCHQQEHAFGDPAVASTGVSGTTGRHSMRLVNARFASEDRFFWDERAPSLEFQTTQPIQDHIEMGFSGADGDPDFSALVARIADMEIYQVLFTAVYGSPDVTEQRMQSALAQFIRSIQSFDSKYDEGLSNAPNPNANFANFTAEENLGKQIFTAPPGPGAGCAGCHRPPTFDIDPNSGHNGIIGSLTGGTDLTNTRSPSLRDVVDSQGRPHGPFMHDGSKTSLLDVINHYNAIPAVTLGLDRRLAGPPPRPGRPPGPAQRLNLTEVEKEALVAFLATLTGSSIYTDEKWSSPFDENNELSFVVLPVTVKVAPDSGQLVLRANGVPRVTYLLKSSADLKTWNEGIEVTANEDGELIHTMEGAPATGFFSFVYQPGE